MPGPSKSLLERVVKLKEHGRNSGLSETDIKRCVENALQVQAEPAADSSAGKQKHAKGARSNRNVGAAGNIIFQSGQVGATPNEDRRKASRASWRKWVLIALCCVVACSCVFAVSIQFKSVQKIIKPYFFDVMRLIRRGTLDIHSRFNVSYYHEELCLVKNPLFTEPDLSDCLSCHGITAVKGHDSKSSLDLKDLSQPLLLQRHLPKAVGWREVAGVVKDVGNKLDIPSLRWRTNLPWMTSIQALWNPGFEEKISASPDFYLQWKCPSLAVGHKVRRLFPRSPFLSNKTEMSLEKIVIMHGPQAKPFFLDKAVAGFVVYIQGSGRNRVHLKPQQKCHGECLLLDVVLEERDMLVTMMDTFTAEVFPQGDGVHVGYLTYIM